MSLQRSNPVIGKGLNRTKSTERSGMKAKVQAELTCGARIISIQSKLTFKSCHTTTYSAKVCRSMRNSARTLVYGDSPVNRGIPLTDAIRKKAIFHTFFSS